jgi:hypothetical protein
MRSRIQRSCLHTCFSCSPRTLLSAAHATTSLRINSSFSSLPPPSLSGLPHCQVTHFVTACRRPVHVCCLNARPPKKLGLYNHHPLSRPLSLVLVTTATLDHAGWILRTTSTLPVHFTGTNSSLFQMSRKLFIVILK